MDTGQLATEPKPRRDLRRGTHITSENRLSLRHGSVCLVGWVIVRVRVSDMVKSDQGCNYEQDLRVLFPFLPAVGKGLSQKPDE